MDVYDRGLRLRELRTKCGFSQAEVARRLGVTRSVISAYEQNYKSPSLAILEQLALLYHTSVDYMLGLENRTCFFIDDLPPKRQEVILEIVKILRDEYEKE